MLGNENLDRITIKRKRGMNEQIVETTEYIKNIRGKMGICKDKVITLMKKQISPTVLLLPEDDYLEFKALISLSRDHYSSVEDWAYFKLGINAVVHGTHIKDIEVY